MKKFLLFLLFLPFTIFSQTVDTIVTPGMTFSPDTVVLNIGESVYFQLGFSHNVIEVDEDLMMKTCHIHGYEYAIITKNDIVIPPEDHDYK